MSVPVGFVIAAWAWAAPEPGGVDAPMAPPMAPSVAPVDAPAAPSVDAEGIPGIPPGIPPNPADVQNLAYRIGLGLRCPVCQGLSVADSTSAAAVQMQMRIRELVALGYDGEQIRAYFVERYGEWILLDPERSGLNLLIWLGPGLGLGLGLAWAATVVLRWRNEPDDVPLASDQGLVPRDRYEQRLLEQLED